MTLFPAVTVTDTTTTTTTTPIAAAAAAGHTNMDKSSTRHSQVIIMHQIQQF